MAFDYFNKALNTINNIPSRTYFCLSQIHFKMKNYNISLEYLRKTLENQSETAHSFIADTFIHMLESRKDIILTKLKWSTGIIIAVKK